MTSEGRDTAVGARLIAWRKARKMSHNRLCGLLGINRQRLWDWETHGVPVGEVRLLTLAMRELTRQSGESFPV